MREGPLPFSPWWLVLAAAVAMGTGGIYQFAWSSIRGPLGAQLGAGETALGTVFTVFIVFQTASQFPAGWVRDRYGPRWPLAAGAGLLALGYLGTASASAVPVVYLSYGVGGVGAGIVYTVAMNTPVKWFDDRRGLATGVVGMTYGGASFLLIPAIRRGITAAFTPTLLALAAGSAVAVAIAAVVLRDPPGLSAGETDVEPTPEPTDADDGAYSWRKTLGTWQFWLLYGVFFVVNGVGLMLIGKAVTYALQFGLTAGVATAGASAIAISDSLGVLGGGWLSDRLGPLRTVTWSLVCSGVVLGASVFAGQAGLGLAFVVFVGAADFFRAPVFAVFPGLVGTYYGESRSSTNYALLYSSKLWGGVFGGTVASGLVVSLGWSQTFELGAILLVAAGVATSLVRPVRAG